MKVTSYNYNSGPIFFKTSNFGIVDNGGILDTLPKGTQITIKGSGDSGNNAGNIWIQTGKSITHIGSTYIYLDYNYSPINTGISCSSDDEQTYTYYLPEDLAVLIHCSDVGNSDDYSNYPPTFQITLNKDAMATVLDVIDLNGGVCDILAESIDNEGVINKLITCLDLELCTDISNEEDIKMFVLISPNACYEDGLLCIKYSDLQLIPTEMEWTMNVSSGDSISICPTWPKIFTFSAELYATPLKTSTYSNGVKITATSIHFRGNLKSGNTLLRLIDISSATNSVSAHESFPISCLGNLKITDILVTIDWRGSGGPFTYPENIPAILYFNLIPE